MQVSSLASKTTLQQQTELLARLMEASAHGRFVQAQFTSDAFKTAAFQPAGDDRPKRDVRKLLNGCVQVCCIPMGEAVNRDVCLIKVHPASKLLSPAGSNPPRRDTVPTRHLVRPGSNAIEFLLGERFYPHVLNDILRVVIVADDSADHLQKAIVELAQLVSRQTPELFSHMPYLLLSATRRICGYASTKTQVG